MCTTFTEHVRSFGPDCDLADCVLPRLERVLRRHLSRRQLQSAPPAYLGYPELSSWQSPGAFDDLVADCYLYAIVRRIEGLRNQLVVRPDIDGLIVVNVRNFLFERQRRHDPIGYATFCNLEAAIGSLEVSGEVVVEDRVDGRLVGTSLVRLRPADPIGDVCDPSSVEGVLAGVHGWSDAISDLTATTEAGQLWIVWCLRALATGGVNRVRVSDLSSAVSRRVRSDWAARHAVPSAEVGAEGGTDEVIRLVRIVGPDTTAADRDQWAQLQQTVSERIAQVQDIALRDRLAAEFATLARLVELGESPSQADLTRELGFPRSTVSRDIARLREIVVEILGGDGTDGGASG